MITKEALAEILGLIRDDGTPMTDGINDKAASGEWPSRLVLGKLRFADPDDVEAILDICKRGGSNASANMASPPESKRRRRTKPSATSPGVSGAFGDLTPLPIRDRRSPHL
ncbi:hypothetical protein ACWEPC_27310 [Nonomuraea sp. NPDC004297]